MTRTLRRKIVDLSVFLLDPRKQVEVFGMFGSDNLGDEAMLVAARKILGTAQTVPWLSYPENHPFRKAVLNRRHRHLLVAGGTLIHGGRTGWLDYVEHRFRQGVPVSFFGTGIAFTPSQVTQPSAPFVRWGRILSGASQVHVRGHRSVEYCRLMGAKAEVFGDFAFLLHDPSLPVRDHARRSDVIGMNFGQCLGDQAKFEEQSAAFVRSVLRNHRVVFHAVQPADVAVCRRIMAAAGIEDDESAIVKEYRNPISFMHSVKGYRAFIGLKMHAAGLAMVAGVPSLMLSYLPKCHDFMSALTPSADMLVDPARVADELGPRLDSLLAAPERFVLVDEIGRLALCQAQTLRKSLPG